MFRKLGLPALCLAAIALTGCSSIEVKSMRDDEKNQVQQSPVDTNAIIINEDKFEPQVISVVAPAKIVIINKDGRAHQIASDPHPTHTDLSDLNSGVLYKGESFSLVIESAGEYKFHLEDNPSVGGKIIVN